MRRANIEIRCRSCRSSGEPILSASWGCPARMIWISLSRAVSKFDSMRTSSRTESSRFCASSMTTTTRFPKRYCSVSKSFSLICISTRPPCRSRTPRPERRDRKRSRGVDIVWNRNTMRALSRRIFRISNSSVVLPNPGRCDQRYKSATSFDPIHERTQRFFIRRGQKQISGVRCDSER